MTDLQDRLREALADRYRIERELGAGGMATVYLAHDLRHARQVAVKVLRPELAAVIGAERFLSEIRTTANLQHPHILPLFDSGVADSFLYYVMPYVQGIALRERLVREKQLPIAESVRIATEIASALDYAHRHGVIHRDIKPENILLHDGSALVADFGIALAASKAGTRMTETGMSLGTPQYMSPEQAMGERELDARSDIYALGCVTYEMLTGEPPFSGPTAQAIVAKVMTTEPADVAALRRTVPPHVSDAVHTALQKLPADRFGSAREFAAALGSASDGGRTRSPGRASAGPARRMRSSPVLLGAVTAAALVAGAAGWAWIGRDDLPAAEPVRVRLQFPATQRMFVRPFPALTGTPDGSGLLYVGFGENTRTQLWLRRWERLDARPFALTVDESCCVTFSPSGDSIAYLSPPRQLNILPLTAGLPRVLPDSGLTSVSDLGGGLDWGADGWMYASGRDGLIRIDPRTGTRELLVPHDTVRGDFAYLWPQLLPGGRGAVVTVVPAAGLSNPQSASIGIADFAARRVDVALQGVRAIFSPTGHLIIARANGVLWAAPIDVASLKLTGAARELADTVAVRTGNAAPGIVDFVLSPNGTFTYVAGGEESYETVLTDRSGAAQPISEPTYNTMDGVSISADGTELVTAIGDDNRALHLWVHPAGGGPAARLTFEGLVNMRARWRPGTSRISFLMGGGAANVAKLRLMELEAGGQGEPREIPVNDSRGIGGHAWSPDGRWLIYRTDDQEPGGGDILAMRPGVDTVARPVAATAAEELAPSISPDGRWIAYTSNESGRREVYVRPFPGTDAARYQVTTTGGLTPVWSRDGRELFYLDIAQNLVSVPLVPGPSFQAGRSRVLFPATGYFVNPYHPQYDQAPDGRFAMIRESGGEDLGVVVVFNFFEEIRRRMAEDD
ncbi:MAG TPA: protein kinase [Gemmatimonadales bacterium]|nr:protein kinase [Gemmatimonadales bacterium]